LIRHQAVAVVAGIALACTGMTACGSSTNSRTIEVDYHNDEFFAAFLGYYPRDVTVTPGMTLKFHQTWTGEPHSVTFGALIDEGIQPVRTLVRGIQDGTMADPGEPPPEYDEELFDSKLPVLFSESEDLGQDAAYPCYLEDEADLPLDHKPCTKAQREQPEFTGRHAYYSSGFIPFEGARGNTFEMKIADDAKEGTYFYYCNAHGVLMSGEVAVKKDADVESQAAINRRGKAEADRIAEKLQAVLDKEKAGNGAFKGNLAGSGDESVEDVHAFASEFTPRTIETTVNSPVKWTFIGDHTISFNVPPYLPIFIFDKNGKFKFNPALDKPKVWPGAPERPEFEGPPQDAPPQEPANIDAGEWDGSGGLHSTGLGFSDGDTYTVTFTKAGTYPYACLIHPGMIGKVVVS
jgi:plastocyanin